MKEIHALGRAPAIRDGDAVLAESGAIVDYIVHRHAGGRLALSPDDPGYARYVYWLHFAEGGGYPRREWWSDEGWAWKEDYDITHHAAAEAGEGRSQQPGVPRRL